MQVEALSLSALAGTVAFGTIVVEAESPAVPVCRTYLDQVPVALMC